MREALIARPDLRKALVDATSSLDGMLATLAGEADPMRSRGLEGAAAAAYFRGYVCLFPESARFENRNRRPPKDPVNACLSLGYTLLHFDAVRACHVAGLDPLVGFYHRPAFGRESMACDLIEPLRPAIDRWTWHLFRDRTLRPESFSQDKGACLLNKAGRGRFYPAYEVVAAGLRRHLRRECSVIARALRSHGAPLLEDASEPSVE
jgi:CRISPR-associated protein Cas1